MNVPDELPNEDDFQACCSMCGADMPASHKPWALWCSSCVTVSFRNWRGLVLPGLIFALCMAAILFRAEARGLLVVAVPLFVLALTLLGLIDLNTRLLPDDITLPLIWTGLLINLATHWVPLPEAVMGAVVGYFSLWALYWLVKLLANEEALGYGDFKLVAAIGAWLGLEGMALALVAGALVHAGYLLLVKLTGRHVSSTHPFGPSLVLGGLIALATRAILMLFPFA